MKPEPEFELVRMVEEYAQKSKKRIKVLYLPVHHPELNPIELMWARFKNKVAASNRTYSLQNVESMIRRECEKCTVEHWRGCEANSRKYLQQYLDLLDELEDEDCEHLQEFVSIMDPNE